MGVVTEEAQEYMVPITVPARNSGKSHSSQQRKIRHIHGGVGKAVGIHSTPLPLSSIKIHLSKGGPDRLNTANIPYFPLLRAVTFPLLRAGTVYSMVEWGRMTMNARIPELIDKFTFYH